MLVLLITYDALSFHPAGCRCEQAAPVRKAASLDAAWLLSSSKVDTLRPLSPSSTSSSSCTPPASPRRPAGDPAVLSRFVSQAYMLEHKCSPAQLRSLVGCLSASQAMPAGTAATGRGSTRDHVTAAAQEHLCMKDAPATVRSRATLSEPLPAAWSALWWRFRKSLAREAARPRRLSMGLPPVGREAALGASAACICFSSTSGASAMLNGSTGRIQLADWFLSAQTSPAQMRPQDCLESLDGAAAAITLSHMCLPAPGGPCAVGIVGLRAADSSQTWSPGHAHQCLSQPRPSSSQQ